MHSQYRLVRARGTNRELGRQHGEQCREQIVGFVDYLGRSLQLSREQMIVRAQRFLALFEQHCPHLVQEVRGLAEGARIPFELALVPQIRGELGHQGDGACTTFVIAGRGSAGGGVLIGQNCDMEPEYGDHGYVLHLEPDRSPALIMWTFGGQIGYHGMNRAGVAHFANALGGGPVWRWGLPHYPVKRMLLERQSLPEALELLRQSSVCSNGNYVLCDGTGAIADVELSSDGCEVIRDRGDGLIVHTNHYLCGGNACQANFNLSLPDSFSRLQRFHELVREKFGAATVGDLQRCLADHYGFPTSVCRHPHDGPDHPSVSSRGRTVTSIVAEPESGQFHIAMGNPCSSEYVTHSIA